MHWTTGARAVGAGLALTTLFGCGILGPDEVTLAVHLQNNDDEFIHIVRPGQNLTNANRIEAGAVLIVNVELEESGDEGAEFIASNTVAAVANVTCFSEDPASKVGDASPPMVTWDGVNLACVDWDPSS